MTPINRLISRAQRLEYLRSLNAPNVIITNEQRLVLEAATALCFPNQ
jgi:DNA-directed RNA polymerase beta' subunit